jgi:tetratricopeptide (TPR) repeat protein
MRVRVVVGLALAVGLSGAGGAIAQPERGAGLPDWARSSALTAEQQTELQRRLNAQAGRIRALAQEVGLRDDVIRTLAIDIFGASPALTPVQYAQAVEEGARRLPETIAAARALNPGGDPVLQGLQARAVAAAEAGRLAEALTLQDEYAAALERALMRAIEEPQLRLAEAHAAAADTAFTLVDFRGAAARYARAAETAPESAQAVRWRYRMQEGAALRTQGERFETTALFEARTVFETRALPLAPRDLAPQDWATTQNALGNVLRNLGERQAWAEGLESLTAARAAYDRALQVRTRATNPQGWAEVQVNLGIVLFRLGEWQAGAEGVASFTAARAAYDRALEVFTRATNPQGWAQVQMNLGIVLVSLGERRAGAEEVASLTAARAAYDSALEVRTRETNPQGWAQVQMNLGNVLSRLGERQAGAEGLASLTAARAAYESALEVRTRETNPQGWAAVQMSLGGVLSDLGTRQAGAEGAASLDAARAAYDRALEVRTRATNSQGWAELQVNLGSLEVSIGDRGDGRAAYARAIQHYRAALRVLTGGEYRRSVERNLAIAEARLAAAGR